MQNSHHNGKIRILSDAALVVQLGEGIHIDIHKKVINFVRLLEENPFDGLVEAVPSYNSVTIFYDPMTVRSYYKSDENISISAIVSRLLQRYLKHLNEDKHYHQRFIEIPVIYGGKHTRPGICCIL